MYRIEVSPGEETVFRNIEELATGIRNGLVTSRSRIHHGASQKWLPIEFHPHYKKALRSLDRPSAHVPAPSPEPAPAHVKIAAHPAPAKIAPFPVPAAAASLPFIPIELPPIEFPMAPAASPAAGGSHDARGSHGSQLPVARRRATSGRPLLYAGAAVALVIVGYLVTSAAPSGRVAAETLPAAADKPAELPTADAKLTPAATTPDSLPDVAPNAARVPARAVAPAVTSAPPPRTGPPSQAWSSSAGATTPPGAAVAQVPIGPVPSPVIIAPAPAAMNLALPSLLVAESLAPKAGSIRDTAAIKRILKAVTGGKPAESKSAP